MKDQTYKDLYKATEKIRSAEFTLGRFSSASDILGLKDLSEELDAVTEDLSKAYKEIHNLLYQAREEE